VPRAITRWIGVITAMYAWPMRVVDVHHGAQHHAGRGAGGGGLFADGHLHVQVLVVLAHHHLGVAQVPDAEDAHAVAHAVAARVAQGLAAGRRVAVIQLAQVLQAHQAHGLAAHEHEGARPRRGAGRNVQPRLQG